MNSQKTSTLVRCLVATALTGALVTGCSTYERKPVPFQAPSAMNSQARIGETIIGARAFDDPEHSKETFGYDILGAGLLPIQVVIDNRGSKPLSVRSNQTFLTDSDGQLWSVLDNDLSTERATYNSKNKEIFSEAGAKGMLGAAAGAVVGTAIGVLSGKNILQSAGKGAVVGAAAGGLLGGASSGMGNEANEKVMSDLHKKMLIGKAIEPGNITTGLLFFPSEAKKASKLRLQLAEERSDVVHTLDINF